jgi:hypothetical protein
LLPALLQASITFSKRGVDARNGRKLKIRSAISKLKRHRDEKRRRVANFRVLQEKADRKKIRELLMAASKRGGEARGAVDDNNT